MDSATITYLINSRRMITPTPKVEINYIDHKERILELTASLFDSKEELLQESFHTYVMECMRFIKYKERETELVKEREQKEKEKEKGKINPIQGDQYMFAPKQIDVLLQKAKKKPKNIFLIHDKT
jgi:hypothetical protein